MHLYDKWRDVTGKPEERVRQEFILHLACLERYGDLSLKAD